MQRQQVTIRRPDEPIHEYLRHNTEAHKRLVTYIANRIRASKDELQKRWDSWDEVDNHWRLGIDLNRSARRVDGTDDASASEFPFQFGVVIPASFAAMNVRLTQEIAHFTARDPIHPIKGVGPEDMQNALVMEAVHAYDMRQSKAVLTHWSLVQDAERYGFGVLDVSWEVEEGTVVDPPQLNINHPFIKAFPNGAAVARRLAPQLFEPRLHYGVKREYVLWRTIDPRRFYADPSYSIGEFHRGQWAGDNRPVTLEHMKQHSIERGGDYFNLDRAADLATRRPEAGERTGSLGSQARAFVDFDITDPTPFDTDHLRIKIIPRDLGLSESDRPELWVFECLDDALIIKAHRAPWYDEGYHYHVAEVQPDPHMFTSPGYAEMCLGLQRFIDWLVNSHFQYTRKRINNALVYSPELIEEDDLLGSNVAGHLQMTPYALQLMVMGRLSPDSLFRQLEMPDTTSDFIRDAQMLFEWQQRQLGASDPISGMPLETRRTYGEVSLVAQAASQRIIQVCQLMDEGAIMPAVNSSIALRQQFTTLEKWVRITGDLLRQVGDERLQIHQYDLWGNFDYIGVPAIRPLEPGRSMEMWLQFLQLGMSIPQMAQMVNWPKVFGEILRNGGIRNYEYFLLPQMPSPTVVPDQQFADMQASGQVVPIEQGMTGQAVQMGAQ
jgi:hypothetical protein